MVILNFWRVAAVVWLIVECWLSHTPGEKSGEESRWLSRTTGIDEGWLRKLAHVFLFAVLSLLAGEAWGWIGVGAAGVWSIVDEATKVWIPGRHCSAVDIGLNLIGCAAGCGCYLLLSR